MNRSASPPAAGAITPRGRGWAFAWCGILLALGLALGHLRPPPSLGGDADPDAFSGAREVAQLRQLLADETPHPVGSIAADQVRERLVTALEELGADVEVVADFACTTNGRRCAHLHNVIATLGSTDDSRPAILLATHYDSVPAGPGAGDDGAGVAAALEVLRTWRSRGAPWPVIALFDEGEEVGLLGARAFVDRPGSLDEVGLILNLEARGTAGRVSMFETKGADTPWVLRYGASVPDMTANSLSTEVYQRMPNDTDLTVFGTTELPGLNFAMIDGVARYHTDRDDLAHLDPRSVQHMGDQVLGILNSVGDDGWPAQRDATAPQVYMDVLGGWLVHWPRAWTVWICGLVAALAWWQLYRGTRPTTTSPLRAVGWILWFVLRALLVPALAFAMAWALQYIAATYLHTSTPGYARGTPLRCGFAVASLAAWGWCMRAGVTRRALPQRAGLALLASIALGLSVVAPGAALPFVAAPGFAVALGLIPWLNRDWPTAAAIGATIPAMVAITILFPLLHGVDLAFGPSPSPALVVLASLLLWTFPSFEAPDATRAFTRFKIAGPLVLLSLSALWSLQVPVFDEDAPQPLSLLRVEEATGGSTNAAVIAWGGWGTRAPLPDAVREDATWRATPSSDPQDAALAAWVPSGSWHHRRVDGSSTPPPRLVSTHHDNGTSLLTLQSRRGAHTLTLKLADPDAVILEIDGHAVPNAPRSVTLFGARNGRSTVLVRHGRGQRRCTVADIVAGVHPLDAARVKTRPEWASPRQWGDRHLVYEVHTLDADRD